jgi:hypothetical protein
MIGQTLSAPWNEEQISDNAIYAGEGDINKGAFVYELRSSGVFTDAQGLTDAQITYKWRSYLNAFGSVNREKRVQSLHWEVSPFEGNVTVRLYDIDGLKKDNLTITEFVTNS